MCSVGIGNQPKKPALLAVADRAVAVRAANAPTDRPKPSETENSAVPRARWLDLCLCVNAVYIRPRRGRPNG